MEPEQVVLNRFYDKLLKELKNHNITVDQYFEEPSKKIGTIQFKEKLKRLGYNEENSDEVNIITNKFQSRFGEQIINLEAIQNELDLYKSNEMGNSFNNIPVINDINDKVHTGTFNDDFQNIPQYTNINDKIQSGTFDQTNLNSFSKLPQFTNLEDKVESTSNNNKFFPNEEALKKINYAKGRINEDIKNYPPFVMTNLYYQLKTKQSATQLNNDYLLNLFVQKDPQNSNYISFDDFFNEINQLYVPTDNEKNIIINEINKENPNADNNQIPYKQFYEFVKNVNENDIKRIKRDFNLKNNQYIINIRNKVKNNGININNEWVTKNNGKTSISKDEFAFFLNKSNLFDDNNPFSNDETDYIFSIISLNGNEVNLREFEKAMNEVEYDPSSYKKYPRGNQDLNNNQRVNKQVFKNDNNNLQDKNNKTNEEYQQSFNPNSQNNNISLTQTNNLQSQLNETNYKPSNFIKVRDNKRYQELSTSDQQNQFFIVQNRINYEKSKIAQILKKHQRYNLYTIYYNILTKFSSFGDEPRKRFAQKDPSNKLLISNFDFYEVLKGFNCNIEPDDFSLLLNSLSSKTKNSYNYDEFLKKVYNIQQIENGQLVLIHQECNLKFNDYIYDFRHWIKDNKFNYKDIYSRQCGNVTVLTYPLFQKFINGLQYNLPHEEELKYLYNNLCDKNYFPYNVKENINEYIYQQKLFEIIEMNDEKEEDFIKRGKVIKDPATKTNWKKNIQTYTLGREGTKELYKKNYMHLENLFHQIHDNCIRYNIENLTDYFDNSNEEISNEGDILKDSFITLMNNIGISQNLTFENLLNSFSYNNKGPKKHLFKLAEFLSIYYCFEDDKNKQGTNISQKKKNEIKEDISTSKIDDKKIVYKNAHRKFTQEDINHVSELCVFIADIIIDEKNQSITDYFKNADNYSKGFIPMDKLKKLFRDDLEIEIDSDNSMNDFFDMVIANEKIEGKDVVKIDHLIRVVKEYSGKDKPIKSNQTNTQQNNTMNKTNTINNSNIPKDKINFQMESSMKGDNAQLIESSSFNNSNLIKKNEPQENENSKRVISSINDNQKNSIKLDDKDKILSNFSHAISNSKIPFYVLFPNVKNNLQNQTIPAEDLKRAFQKANYPIKDQEFNILMQSFDPLQRSKVEVNKLKEEIQKNEPNYFNQNYQDPNKAINSADNQFKSTLNSQIPMNSTLNGMSKIKSYLNDNNIPPQSYFTSIFNKQSPTDTISKDEFKSTLKQSNGPYAQISGLNDNELEEVYQIIDNDKDNKIKITDLLKYFSDDKNINNIKLNKTMVNNIDSLFNTVDTDQNNLISVEEFYKCLKSVDYKATKKDAEDIVRKYDPNSSSLNRTNFNDAISRYIKEQLIIQNDQRNYIKKLFIEADIDKEGFLSEKQLKYLIKSKLKTNFTDEEIDLICKNASAKYDGRIDIDEFINLLDSINGYDENENENEINTSNSIINEALKNINLNLNLYRNVQPKTFISLYNGLPLTFIPSFIREEQKLLKLLPSSVLKPRRNGVFFEDIMSVQEAPKSDKYNNNKNKLNYQGEKILNPINTKINCKISFIDFATGVPSPDENLFKDSNSQLKIVGRLLKIALFNTRTNNFIGNAISIDCQYKKEYSDRWYFESDRKLYNNNIIIRYDYIDTESVEVIFEFVLVIQKIVDNEIYTFETSCGWSEIRINECTIKKDEKLPINAGSPFKSDKINPQDIKTVRIGFIPKIKSLFSGEVKPLLPIRIKPYKVLNIYDKGYIDFLPKIIVCHRAALPLIAIYRKMIGKFILNHKDYSLKVIKVEDSNANAFCNIADCPDAFRMMVELFKEIIIDGETNKSDNFYEQCLKDFVNRINSVLFAEKFKYDPLDPTKVPRGDIHLMENRNNLINSVIRHDKNKKFNPLDYDNVEKQTSFQPFSVDEISNNKIDIVSKLDELISFPK